MRYKFWLSLLSLVSVLLVLCLCSSAVRSDDDVVALINTERAERGLAPFQRDACLHSAAQRHSQDMADHGFCGHTGSDGSTLADRIAAAGYRYYSAAETVACGFGSPDSALAAWMASQPHRQALMGSFYEDIGCANVMGRWTCDLGTGSCMVPTDPTLLHPRVWLPLMTKRR